MKFGTAFPQFCTHSTLSCLKVAMNLFLKVSVMKTSLISSFVSLVSFVFDESLLWSDVDSWQAEVHADVLFAAAGSN